MNTATQTATQSPTRQPSASRPTPLTIGPFTVEAALGEGGMGAVYAARDTRHGARVALKLLLGGIDELRLRALKREFRLASEFSHRNVVEMYDLRAEQGEWFIVMELVDGSDFLQAASAAPEREAWLLEALRQLTRGLHALHGAGWIHRDLKSSNVLVEAVTGRVVILDFGLAQSVHSQAVSERRLLGTLSHMAPELFSGQAATAASDWYAMGAMLCSALLGQLPPAHGRVAACRAEAARASEGPRRMLLTLAADLLQEEPSERPDAAELFERLALEPVSGPGGPLALQGRERQLVELIDGFERARRGELVAIALEAPAGLGKSALAAHFLDELEASKGAEVFRARCHSNEHIPFKAVDRLVESLLTRALSGGASTASARRVGELFPALRDLIGAGEPAAPVEPPPAQRRAEAFGELRAVLEGIRDARPVVIFIDDVHYGDADSASLLRGLFGECSTKPPGGVLLLWTQRPGSEDSPFLGEARRGLGLMPQPRTVALPPLDAAVATRLVRSVSSSLTEQEVDSLVAKVDGNPLMLIKAGQSVRQPSGNGSSLLESVVDADLESTGRAATRLLGIVAIASAPLALEAALLACGTDPDGYRSLHALRKVRLVTIVTNSAAEDSRLELSHDALREAVLNRVTKGQLAQLHLDLARSLEKGPHADPGMLSVHFHAAGEPEPAVRYAERAAAEAEAVLAFAAAARHLKNVLAWGPSENDVHLQTRLAQALFDAGDCVTAARVYQRAGAGATAQLRRELSVKQALAWFSAGHVDDGARAIRSTLNDVGVTVPSKAWLMPAILANLLKLRWQGLQSHAKTRSAVDDERVFRADACWSMGCGLSIFLSMQGSYFIVKSLLEALHLDDARRIGRGLAFVGGVCANIPSISAWGEACLQEAETLAGRDGDPYLDGWCKVWRANAALNAGRFEDANALARTAIEQIANSPYAMTWERNTARCFALMAIERLGDLSGVEREAQQVAQHASLNEDLYGSVVFSLFVAQVSLAKDEVERARQLARESMARWTKDSFTIQHFYAIRVETYCDLYEGRVDAARARLLESWKAIQRSDVAIVASAKMESLLLRGQVELAVPIGQRRRGALKAVTGFIKSMTSLGAEGAAFGRLLRACALMLDGFRAEAGTEAEAARVDFDALGMRLWAHVSQRSHAHANADTAGVMSAETTLRQLGVKDLRRWLATMTPGFA